MTDVFSPCIKVKKKEKETQFYDSKLEIDDEVCNCQSKKHLNNVTIDYLQLTLQGQHDFFKQINTDTGICAKTIRKHRFVPNLSTLAQI